MNASTEEKILETQSAIVEYKDSIEKGTRFKKLTEDSKFKEFISDGLLGETMNKIALALTFENANDDDDNKSLEELKSLRKLKLFIAQTLNRLESDKKDLDEHEKYLSALLSGEVK